MIYSENKISPRIAALSSAILGEYPKSRRRGEKPRMIEIYHACGKI